MGYVENNLYKKQGDRTFNNTNIRKHINQCSTDVFNNYKTNKTHNAKNAYYNYNNDVFINTHNTMDTNGTYNITRIIVYIMLLIIINVTRHNHNNYEHNVIKQIHNI